MGIQQPTIIRYSIVYYHSLNLGGGGGGEGLRPLPHPPPHPSAAPNRTETVNGKLVHDIILDTGASKTIIRKELVRKGKMLIDVWRSSVRMGTKLHTLLQT